MAFTAAQLTNLINQYGGNPGESDVNYWQRELAAMTNPEPIVEPIEKNPVGDPGFTRNAPFTPNIGGGGYMTPDYTLGGMTGNINQGPMPIEKNPVGDPGFTRNQPFTPNISGGVPLEGGSTQSTTQGFDVPAEAYPRSTTTSRSGLDPELIKKLIGLVYPQLESSLTNYSATIDDLMQQALGTYNTQMQNALRGSIPNAVNALSQRGILHGTEAQKILAQIAKEAAMESATKGYETALQAATQKLNMPNMLSSILGGTNVSEGTGTSTDESAPYRIMAGLLQSLM
uniref:Uncharacterized protein n=1 Tax=viral metagenome TaxID=1070528 RepID=A0A6M3KAH0_9ZZZZ